MTLVRTGSLTRLQRWHENIYTRGIHEKWYEPGGVAGIVVRPPPKKETGGVNPDNYWDHRPDVEEGREIGISHEKALRWGSS
jgi:hypothetical protein